MDIYDYLKKDHAKVAHLFSLFEKTDDKAYKLGISDMINRELLLHAPSEQETFYKALEQFDETRDIALHGEKEHKEIENLINEIASIQKVDAAWEKKVLKLKELVDHHVKDEEGEIFNKAKKVLTSAQAYFLKEQMHDYKDKILQTMDS
jgi:hemerythrin superfamily protein